MKRIDAHEKAWGLFLESPETFRAHFGWHNSLCIFKTKASGGTKLCSYFYLYSLSKVWKDQLCRSRAEFYEWLFGPEKPFVIVRPAYSVKLVFSYVVKGIKTKITGKFCASRRLCFEDTKKIMLPEIRPKSFGTFEKQAPHSRHIVSHVCHIVGTSLLRGIDCNPNQCHPKSQAPLEMKVHNAKKKHLFLILTLNQSQFILYRH